MSNKSNIEEEFKNVFEHFEADVNPHVWNGIEQNISGGSGPAVDASSIAKTLVSSGKLIAFTAVVLTGVLSVSYFLFYNSKPVNSSVTNSQLKIQPVVAEPLQSVTPTIVEKSSMTTETPAVVDKNELEKPGKITAKEINADKAEVVNNNSVTTAQPLETKIDETTSNANSTDKNYANPVPSNSSADEKHENISSPAVDAENASVTKTNANFDWGLIPNAFSPNADGKNDVFKITNPNIETIKVDIIDRNGKQVHEWTGINGFWDGKDISGNDLPKGVYYYFIFATSLDGEVLKTKGTITLLR